MRKISTVVLACGLFALLTMFAPKVGAQPDAQALLPVTGDGDGWWLARSIFDEVVHGRGWNIAALVLMGLVWLLRTAKSPIVKFVPFFKTDRGGAVLVLIMSFLGAVATSIMASHGMPSFEVVLRAVQIALEAAGGWAIIKKIIGGSGNLLDGVTSSSGSSPGGG